MPTSDPSNVDHVGKLGLLMTAIIGAITGFFGWLTSVGRNHTDREIKTADANVTATNNLILGLQASVSSLESENRSLRFEMIEIRAVNVRLNDALALMNEKLNEALAKMTSMQASHTLEINSIRKAHTDEMTYLRAHVDSSTLVLQAGAAVPTMMLHDDLKEIKSRIDANTTSSESGTTPG